MVQSADKSFVELGRLMIENEVWIEGIAGTADLIATGVIDHVWSTKEYGLTSILYYDELYEQVIGDLDSEEILKQFCRSELYTPELKAAASDFIAELMELDRKIVGSKLKAEADILNMPEWRHFKKTSAVVAQEYRTSLGGE